MKLKKYIIELDIFTEITDKQIIEGIIIEQLKHNFYSGSIKQVREVKLNKKEKEFYG